MALQSQIETNFTRSPPDLPAEGVGKSGSGRSPLAVPLILFVITCFTTLMTGSYQEGGDPFARPIDLVKGIPFAFTLMLILFVHEMGHYLTAQAYGVKTSFPYFLPGPWPPL